MADVTNDPSAASHRDADVLPDTERLQVRPITADEHLAFVVDASGSFLQTPAWGAVKNEWSHESLGWFAADRLVGVALVLYRRLPVGRGALAYIPEGPVADWSTYSAHAVTTPLLQHLRARRAFAVKIGPQVVLRRWRDDTVKRGIKDGRACLGDVPADTVAASGQRLAAELRSLGWRQERSAAGFGDLQPRHVFQVPLGGRDRDALLSAMNQQWRRNIRKAHEAGVVVQRGTFDDLAGFHAIYVETAERDGFRPRPLSYFQRMWQAMYAEDEDRIRLYLARHDQQLLAATTWVRVGRRVWYSYGASSTAGRDLRPSNAVQWAMMTDALDMGADVYDLRGISDTLSAADPLFGLIRFKLGTGGEAVEYVGEWDYALRPLLDKAFRLYLAYRS